MKKIIWGIPIVVVIVVIIALAGGRKEESKTFRIGVSTPTTGPIAFAGEGFITGLKAAQKKINETGGINGRNLELLIQDNANEAKATLASFEKLRQSKPDVYLISGTVPAAAVSPVADQAGIPLFVSMSFANTQAKFENQVSFYATVGDEVGAIMKSMVANKHMKIAVIYLNTDYGQAVLSAFKAEAARNGIIITSEDSFLATDASYTTQITKALASKPQAVFLIALNQIPIIKQLKTFKSGVGIYANNQGTSGNLINVDPATYEGVYLTGYASTIPGTPEYAKIRTELGTTTTNNTFGYAAAACDNLMAIAAVLKKDPDTANFVKNFSSYGSFVGVNGTYELTSRNISIPLHPVLFKGGVLMEVK